MDNKFVISKNDIKMLLAEEFHDPEIILISEHPNAKLRQCLISNIDRSEADGTVYCDMLTLETDAQVAEATTPAGRLLVSISEHHAVYTGGQDFP